MTNFLDIIHRLYLIKKKPHTHNILETGVCLCHQVKKRTPTLLGPIDRASPCLHLSIGPNRVGVLFFLPDDGDRLQSAKRHVRFLSSIDNG
jgi:hypothetical protein